VDEIEASDTGTESWHWDRKGQLWFVDGKLKTRVSVGSVLLALSAESELWQAQVTDFSRESPNIEVAWFYSSDDLENARFDPKTLALYGVTRALSDWYQEIPWGQVIGVGVAAPSEFFYDANADTLTGRVGGQAVVLRADGSDVTTTDLVELALDWAKAAPGKEHGTKFGQMVLDELAMSNLNNFGPRDAMEETVWRLSMMPHRLARKRGLAPTGVEHWTVEPLVGPATKGTCHACYLERFLSMELVNEKTGARFLVGNDCGGRLDRMLSCCKTLNVLRDTAREARQADIRPLLSHLDKLFVLN